MLYPTCLKSGTFCGVEEEGKVLGKKSKNIIKKFYYPEFYIVAAFKNKTRERVLGDISWFPFNFWLRIFNVLSVSLHF